MPNSIVTSLRPVVSCIVLVWYRDMDAQQELQTGQVRDLVLMIFFFFFLSKHTRTIMLMAGRLPEGEI